MSKPRYRLDADGKTHRIPVSATTRFVNAAMERWRSSLFGRIGIDPYGPNECDAHGIHLRDMLDAAKGATTTGALRARVLWLWMGVDCVNRQINEPTVEQAAALDMLVTRTNDLIKQAHRERRKSNLRLYIREFPDLARAEVASLTR